MIVRDAARATLAAGTARVWQIRFVEGRDAVNWLEQGVTEFARRRTRTTSTTAIPEGWEALARSVAERWPWFFGDEDDGAPPEMLYAGTATWFIAGGTASRQAFGDPAAPRRFHVDPTWILDVLEYVAHEERRAADHHAFSCDLEDTGDAILPPPHRGRRRPRITGEAWLDGAGRIRRVTWRASGTVTWTTTDLWDFGTPVELDLPEPQSSPSTLRVLYGWRRAKRAYERGR